jgi:hypothetical protein
MKYAWLLVLGLLVVPGAARAQRGPSCDLSDSRQLNSVADGQVIYIGGPVFVCDNGTRILADSAIYLRAPGRIDFHGNVRFDETDRSLTSMYAQYFGTERRLMAQQDVVLINKKDGSTLRAPALNYFQQSPGNPKARIEVYSGRPRATLFRQNPDNSSVIDTTIVDADRMQVEGEEIFRGWGAVEVKRGRLISKSAFAEFDQGGSYMKLYGKATVDSDTFHLSADSIDADLINNDEFREVRARRDAKLASQDVNVDAPRLKITFNSGKVERLVAIGGKRVAGSDLPQASATSQDFTLTADSIDAISPAEQLERVIAIGTAFGERHADSADVSLPELIRQDWVRGDTVTAYFGAGRDTTALPAPAASPAAGADTARVLERIVASGAPASSTYKLRERVNDTTEVSVNYITARHIDVILRGGDVDRVRAEGNIRGMYLQPPKPEAVAREDERP